MAGFRGKAPQALWDITAQLTRLLQNDLDGGFLHGFEKVANRALPNEEAQRLHPRQLAEPRTPKPQTPHRPETKNGSGAFSEWVCCTSQTGKAHVAKKAPDPKKKARGET